jgi:PAS domain S-box-containing protein
MLRRDRLSASRNKFLERVMENIEGRKAVWLIVAVYVVFSGLWIFLSDTILGWLIRDQAQMIELSIYKGFLFIVVTASILYHLIGRYARRMENQLAERSQAEKDAAFFRTMVEYTRDPVYVLDSKDGGRMVYANQAACIHYGKTLDELVTMRIPDWDPDFDMANIEPILQLMREGKPVRFETRHRVASGELVPVEVTASLLVHDGRELTAGYFYDISERKALETELLESEARNLSLFQELQALLDTIPDGLTLLSPDLRILWVNSHNEQLTGVKMAEQIGRKCYELRHGLDQPCECCQVIETFETGKPACMIRKVVTPAGERIMELRTAPIKDDDGKVVKTIEINRDITEIRRMEEEILRSQKLESVGLLAGGIAHDFNNLLTAILGNISLAKAILPQQERSWQRLTEAEKATLRARDLTRQLLTFAKGGAPVRRSASIGDLILETAGFALSGSKVRCEFNIDSDLSPAEIDEGQISQVIHNLIINADQSMPLGGTLRIACDETFLGDGEIAPLKEGRYLRITVSDQGVGIPMEHLPRIFDPFFTTKEKGRGLGLATAYSIIRNHDGLLSVSSSPGVGTTFTVHLPVSAVTAEVKADEYLEIRRGRGRLLVMDDEETVLEIASGILSYLGYDVVCAREGGEAAELYRKESERGNPFSAVIADLTIPGGKGGKEMLEILREFDPGARVIVSSGYSNDPIMSEYRAHGFSGVICKPYLVEEVSKVVAEVLG